MMTQPTPIYTAENCRPAWQLDWTLTIFWREPPRSDDWLTALRDATEQEGVRILSHRFPTPDSSQFLISTKPTVRPVDLVRSVKGRLQYLVRERWPKALQRNYDLHSIGSTQLGKVESYVASQLEHHPIESAVLKAQLFDLQVVRPDVDLSQYRFTAHARYRCNLHLSFVNDGRWRESRPQVLERVRAMILKASDAKGHLLSRVGLLPDHLHLVLGFSPEESPLDVALSYMNNIAFVDDMQPVLMRSCYLGTVGEYDLGALRQ